MKRIKHLFTALFLLFVTVGMYAQSLPKVSSGYAEYWYAISFPYSGSGKGITAYEAGEVTTAEITGDAAQMWKITGNDNDGYAFTNKNGLVLCVESAERDMFVNAEQGEVYVSRFIICNVDGNLEIRPKDNQNLSMNFWSGTGTRVGLWYAEPADANNYVGFIEVEVAGDYVFTVLDGVNVLTQYLGNETRVELPDNYKGEGYIIGARAFANNTHVENITIPECVTAIGDAAFYGCTNLLKITMSDNVVSVGVDAFTNTPWYNNEPEGLIYVGKVLYKYKGTMPQGTSVEVKAGTLGIAGSAFYNCSGLTSVVIPNSVTSIGYYAFRYCSGLTSIEIPNSVTSIGHSAFHGCSGLTSVTIGNSVTSIGNYTFDGCTSLKDLRIEDGKSTLSLGYNGIGEGLFYDCPLKTLYLGRNLSYDTSSSYGYSPFYNIKTLVSVTIGNSVTSIGDYAFNGCTSLKDLRIEDGEGTLSLGYNSSNEGLFYDCPLETLYLGRNLSYTTYIPNGYSPFYNKSSLTSVTIGNSVTRIGGSAFRDCSGLTSVEIPNSVTRIGNDAFRGCSGLTSVEIPNSVTSIGDYAFNGCTSLKDIRIEDGEGTLSLGYNGSSEGLFYDCPLKTLYLGRNLSYDTSSSYGYSPFYNKTTLASVTIGNYVTSIRENAFRNCSGLTSVEIPNSVTSIGIYAFNGCTSLKNLRIEDGESRLSLGYNYDGGSATGEGLFYDCPLETLYLGRYLSYNTGSSYGYSPFYNKSSLTSVTIGNSVTSIGEKAFWNCSGLTSVVIGNSVTSIGWCAFSDCSSLTSVEIPNSVTSIGVAAFSDCSGLTSIVIPNSVTSIGGSAFSDCSGLKTVINYSSLTISKGSDNYGYVGYYADKVINAPNGTIEGDFLFGIIDGVNTLVEYLGNDTEIVLPDNYKGGSYVIGAEAFYDNTSITSIVISNSVTSIGSNAFNGCSGLTSIEIPNSVTSIGYYAFKGCSGLTSVVIGNSVTSIGDHAFDDCSGLTSVEFNAENCTTMGSSSDPVFSGCTALLTVTIGENVKNIPAYAFNGCSGLTSVEIPVGVESIGAAAFKNCAALAYISIPNSVKDIANDAFDGCIALKKVELNTTTVENWFSGYTSIKEIVTGNSVTSIVGRAFSGCTNLTSLTVGSKVANIGEYAFNGCGNIIKVFWLGNTPPAGYEQLSGKINYVANNQYTNLVGEVVVSQFLSSKFEIDGTVYVPTSLSDRTCCVVDYDILSDVSDVVIKETVSYQGVSLKVQDIKPYSFYGKENLETVLFEHNGGIGTSAFEGCTSLKNIEIPYTVTFVGDHAFRNCTKLTDAKINNRETVLPLGMQLFANTAIESLYIDSKISYEESDRKISPFSENCTLKSVVITNAESNIYDYEFYNCTALESAVVGDGVEKIGRWAFSGCLNLKDFVFGSNLEEIGEEAFSDCSGLVQITGRAVLPPVCGDQALDDINRWTCKLYVPTVNLEAYKSAPQWKEFLFVEELVTTDNYVTYKIDGEVYKTLLIKPGERIITPTVDEKEGYTFCGWDLSEYISTDGYPVMPDEDIVVEGSYIADKFMITYIVDGELYATDEVAYGSEIVLIETPTKEGYTFSGWSEVPATMPAKDITVEGTYIADKFMITYIVDGELYATDKVAYGSEIVLIETPTKEGYTFRGWNEVPATMPAEDITVTGSFAVNYYTVTYIVDGEEYETMTVEYGKEITLPATPEKEGHTFSGWSEVPATMPAEEITVTGSFAVNYYTVTYIVDGEEYEIMTVEYGKEITLPATPEKEGHTFSGWSEVLATMPAEDITVEGLFAVNYYTVTYKVDGEVYATDSVSYGSEIVLIEEPVKEGYTFSGWSEVPATMPAEDITVEGSFAVNYYTITYMLDGEVYATDSVSYGSEIVLIEEPTKEGYTFVGWNEVPETMPAEDITIEAIFTVNSYLVTFFVDGEKYHEESVEYGARIPLVPTPFKAGYTFSGWRNVPQTMPARDVYIYGSFYIIETGIDEVKEELNKVKIYNLKGERIINTENLPKGIYIIDGKKVFIK